MPLLPEVIVTQDALLAAVQPQPPVLVTATLVLPPVEATDALVGERENPQDWVVALAAVDWAD